MLSNIIKKINAEYIKEAKNSPYLLEDMAAMEKYMAESYNGRIFIELLQNADDSESSKILVEEYQGNIIFANNGRIFDENDIISISRSGASKKERGSKIGYRGIGFKSTAYLTSEIIIYSDDTYFTFSKEKCSQVLNKPSDTLPTVRIPFIVNSLDSHLKDYVSNLVSRNYTTIFIFTNAKLNQFREEIRELNNGYFMFLHNITDCKIRMNNLNFSLHRELNTFGNYNIIKFNGHKEEKWLIIRKNNVALAFKFYNNKITPCDSSEAIYHCFLPTLDKSPFLMKLNADFSTDPSRKHITQDELTDSAIDSISQLLFETLNIALKERNSMFTEYLDIITMITSFSIMNQKLLNKLNELIQKHLFFEMTDNSTQVISKCKLIPNTFENSEKHILRKSECIGKQSIKSDYYESFPMIDKFIEKHSQDTFSSQDISLSLSEKSFVENLNPQTYAKILSCVASATKVESINNKNSFSTQKILIPCDSGVFNLVQVGEKLKPSENIKRAISENMSSYDINILSSKLGISSESIFIQRDTKMYNVNLHNKKDTIPMNKPTISKWRSAELQCIELEKFFKNEAIDVSRQNVGYDLESTKPNGEKRYIEVKLLNNTSSSFTITNNEYTAAHQYGPNYYLCLLIQSDNESKAIYINNPLKTLHFEKKVSAMGVVL